MAKLAKTTMFPSGALQKETALDKTTRIVTRMNDEDAEKRRLKLARLRNDRLTMEADDTAQKTTAIPSKTTSGKAGKKK
jgi:hypothetical protein